MQYRLFGNLELLPPEEFLSSERLKRLHRIKANLVQFEATEPQTFVSNDKQALHEVISDFVEPKGKVAPLSPSSHQITCEFLEPEPHVLLGPERSRRENEPWDLEYAFSRCAIREMALAMARGLFMNSWALLVLSPLIWLNVFVIHRSTTKTSTK